MIICSSFIFCRNRRKNSKNDCADEQGDNDDRDGGVHIVDIVAVNAARDTRNQQQYAPQCTRNDIAI